MNKKIFLWVLFFFTAVAYAEEYSFDVDEYEEKSYEFNGNIRLNSIFIYNNRNSKLFILKYYNRERDDYSLMYYIRPELFLKYNYDKISFNCGGNLNLYNIDNEWDNKETLYECNLNYSPENFSIDIGKKNLIWGKGYIWNPVSYAGRQKNVDDIDAALEGYYLLNLKWVKSFESCLSNIAINFVILPSYNKFNEDFDNIYTDYEDLGYENNYYETTHFITKLYGLLFNTDIGFYLLLNHRNSNKAGIDFSKNLLTSWEIHFEYSYENRYTQYYMDESGAVENKTRQNNNFLAGTRYLTDNEITFILEYLHNSGGLTKDQSDIFYNQIEFSLNNGTAVSYYKKNSLYLNRQFVSKDYIYFKAIRPQPFDILYFTPSFYSVFNFTDRSQISTIEFKYTGITDFEFILKGSFLSGSSLTQYSEKVSRQKYNFQLRYYF